jgi:hypothetical protein
MVAELADVDKRTVGDLVALEADLYENRWAGPLASSIRASGGQLVASGRVPTQALLAAIEADAQPELQTARHAAGQRTQRSPGRDWRTGDPDGGGCRSRRRRRAWSRSARRPSRPARGSSRRPRDLPVDTTRRV